jgi:hypothetical protein
MKNIIKQKMADRTPVRGHGIDADMATPVFAQDSPARVVTST